MNKPMLSVWISDSTVASPLRSLAHEEFRAIGDLLQFELADHSFYFVNASRLVEFIIFEGQPGDQEAP